MSVYSTADKALIEADVVFDFTCVSVHELKI